jgi:arginase
MRNQFLLSPFFLDEPRPALQRLAAPAWRLNRPSLDGGTRLTRMAAVHRSLADLVEETARRGDRPVSIAGDCCTPIGVLSGLQRAGIKPVVVWLDAHGDFNTYETTRSGFIGGMPLAMIVGRGEQFLVEAAELHPVPEADVVLADARDLDPGERQLLDDSAVHRVADLTRLAEALPPDRPIYVHFDVDVLSPADAPAVLYPAAGGPSFAVMKDAAAGLAATGRVVAVSVTPWELDVDANGQTERASLEVLAALVA